jgi:hypothetical protein
MDYVKKLENYDAPDIANIAVGSELYEEAFYIYKRHDQHVNAVVVLLSNIGNVDRAYEYAEDVDRADVWSKLAKAQLDTLRFKDAVGKYMSLKKVESMLIAPLPQTHTLEPRTHQTSTKSFKWPKQLTNTTTLCASYIWRERLFASQLLRANSFLPLLKQADLRNLRSLSLVPTLRK